MRSIIPLSICLSLLLSCTMKSGVETTASDSIAVDTVMTSASAMDEPHSKWIIPLTDAWKDPDHFVLVIPDSSGEFEFWKDPTFTKYDQSIGDTAMGKFNKTAQGIDNCGQRTFHEIQLDKGDRPHGWATEGHLLFIGGKSLGEYVINGRTLQLGAMKYRETPYISDALDDECGILHTLFFYNDKYLYLIDASKAGEDLRWHKEAHLTIVNQVPGISVSGKQQGNDFVIQWSEPNMSAEVLITWDTDHLKFVSRQDKSMESDVDDLEPETVEEIELKTATCTFKDGSSGDCFHLVFSCGDFGNADDSKLKGKDRELWQSLTTTDQEDNSIGNPKYVNKSFEITYYYTRGKICGYYGETETSDSVQVITSFKLK